MNPNNRTHIIDRESPIPIYHQIAMDIIDRITLGEWEIGDKLPSEAVLHEEYNVSPITLRQALKNLEDARLIVKHQGKGTFLQDTPKPFVEDLAIPGTHQSSGLSKNISHIVEWRRGETPSLSLRQLFHIDSSGSMIFLRRIFLREKRVLGLNDIWFPEKHVPGIMEEGLINGSVSTTLKKRYGHHIISVENYIESERLNAPEAALLETDYNSPVLRIYSAHKNSKGEIVEYSCSSWLGNLTRFHISVDV